MVSVSWGNFEYSLLGYMFNMRHYHTVERERERERKQTTFISRYRQMGLCESVPDIEQQQKKKKKKKKKNGKLLL